MHWEALAPQLALDGASVCRDGAWRDEMRGRYVRQVLQGLHERCGSERVGGIWEFPADLAVVLRHVDSQEGPGWHKYRYEQESLVFLEGWVRDAGQRDPPAEQTAATLVRTPGEIIESKAPFGYEYEIAGGWACSETGGEATCYVVYSRPRDAAGGEEEERRWDSTARKCLRTWSSCSIGTSLTMSPKRRTGLFLQRMCSRDEPPTWQNWQHASTCIHLCFYLHNINHPLRYSQSITCNP